jgi:hypothetical protein
MSRFGLLDFSSLASVFVVLKPLMKSIGEVWGLGENALLCSYVDVIDIITYYR